MQFGQVNKANDNDWFTIECNKTGTRWTGKCWYIHDMLRYEFDLQFDVRSLLPRVPRPLPLLLTA